MYFEKKCKQPSPIIILRKQCLFCRQYSGGNRSAGAIVLPVEHSVLWHDTIQIKRSVCHAIGVLLIA